MNLKNKFLIFLLLVFCINHNSKSFTDALKQSYKVYNPNWSIAENNGSLGIGSLAPYKLIEDEAKKGKIPLILIHGTVSEGRPYCNWFNLLQELEKPENKNFFDKHPVYIFRYASTTNSWINTSNSLKQGLEELLNDYPPNTKFKVVISSLGGNLFCSAVQRNSDLNKKFLKGVSLGTPFWGTPLLNKELMLENSKSSDKFINWSLGQATDFLFPQLSAQLPWMLPLSEKKKNVSHNCAHLRSRLINYGAFIKSPLTQTADLKEYELNKWLIKQISQSNYKHAWDGAMHYKMGYEIEQNFKPIYLFRFNDGLVPIFSSLWLNPNLSNFEGQKALTKKTLQQIKTMNPKARLFEGLDHSNLTSSEEMSETFKDLLHSSSKPISFYIMHDLE